MEPPIDRLCPDEAATRALGAEMGKIWKAGDCVLLEGDLGAGKTTFVRGLLEGLGFVGAVRSPTFNLLQTFPTEPPVLHADFYRLPSARGLGLEDYFESHLVLVEWPDRARELFEGLGVWRVQIATQGDVRRIQVSGPKPI